MIENIPTDEDIDALWEYVHGQARNYHGMSYAEGIGAMLDWIQGNSPRPDKEEE